MISHVFVGITDFDRAFKFYLAVLGELGLKLKFCERDTPWAGWMPADAPRPLFLIGRPYDGNTARFENGQMVALLAPDRGPAKRSQTRSPWRQVEATSRTTSHGGWLHA